MKGLLLHGGHGTRLRPLTHTGPKQLIPVAGKPISQYCLEDMRYAGITEVAIILGPVWPEKVREFFGDGSRLGMRLRYIDQGEPVGLAHAIGLAKEFVGQEQFVVYLGDNLLKGGIANHAASFSSENPDAMVLLSKVLDPQRFGVARLSTDGKLEGLIEKPKEPPSPYALVGVYFLTPKIFDTIGKLKPSWRGEFEITDAIQLLINDGCTVRHRFVEGWWKDTGTPEDILDANRLVLDEKLGDSTVEGIVEQGASVQGRVRVQQGAKVREGATVRGPAHVGNGSIVGSGAFIGPYTSIGNQCRLESCDIENSIVMDGCTINARARIVDSLIGPQSVITRRDRNMRKGFRLVLGERSSLQI